MNKTSEQNRRTRDMEVKNKLTVTRGEERGDNGGKKGKGCQGTCIKTHGQSQQGGGGIECGRWGWVGWRRVMGGKWGQL